MLNNLKQVLENMPADWLNLTTHRLDIYNEALAKTEFVEAFEKLASTSNSDMAALASLPTAYDYVRLGHPLSCVLEWAVAKKNKLKATQVISFSSKTTPLLAILRKNLFLHKKTQIVFTGEPPHFINEALIKNIYGYDFELHQVISMDDIPSFEGSTVFISQEDSLNHFKKESSVDFFLNTHAQLGSILLVNGSHNEKYISEIQHVRRRETIAMSPANCLLALQEMVNNKPVTHQDSSANKKAVIEAIAKITEAPTKAVVGSSGLSVQYAIMMGLIHDAQENHKGKAIKFIVPPNCYGGTNDQARRVAACLDNVAVVDLPVDGKNDMVQSVTKVLKQMADEDAVPYIIAEIPTNPRVEVPDMIALEAALSTQRKTSEGEIAIDPVFILDQTFCPNLHFLGDGEILSSVRTLSYASGSKFPSGGKCTAGYVVGNKKTERLMQKIEMHLELCDNEATSLQYEILAKQLPSMLSRIKDAYQNTREFVNHIQTSLPTAKINFVSEELANQGFTPSVFSLDLPTKGNTAEEKEAYKRELNHKLISLMITKIPKESKYCVSYGQLKGCYWTIPATSTQGTTKEGDKDYIARVSVSPDLDLELHKEVFSEFVAQL